MARATDMTLPGFGLPLDSVPKWERRGEKNRFPHAIADYVATEGVTVRERRMLDFMNQITDKPKWIEKVHDEKIIAKWRTEACGTEYQQKHSPLHMSQLCFDYCVRELQDKAKYLQMYGVVHVLDVNATVVKTDINVDDGFAQALGRAVHHLEDVPELRKDWHPGSDDLVLDLVHPSLFPLAYGRSRVLPSGKVDLLNCSEYIGCGRVCPEPEAVTANKSHNRNNGTLKPWGSYQWLPSDIRFGGDGTARIESYINNLHPRLHADLYHILGEAVDRALPLWNDCLSDYRDKLRIKIDSCGTEDFKPVSRATLGMADGTGNSEDVELDPVIDWSSWNPEVQDWLRDHPDEREICHPDPTESFVSFQESITKDNLRRLDLRSDFPDGVQIIFKLANIHLTPQKPRYNGSNWHVEGALNEHICATALFYYDQANIQDSYLEFRHEVDSESMIMKAGQEDWQAAEDLFGIQYEGPAVQELGKVLTREGRIVAFPNVMQHRVRPFGLVDPSKPGHRKILAMFLVDPYIKILSTANVPPQRKDWWADELRKIHRFGNLPVELFAQIIDDVEDFPIGWEDACEAREELMAERGRMTDELDGAITEDTFFFCEH